MPRRKRSLGSTVAAAAAAAADGDLEGPYFEESVNNTNGQNGMNGSHTALTDPTANAHEMVRAAVRRIDDILNVNFARLEDQIQAERRRVDEQMQLRAEYNVQLNVAETKRIDAIRAVDVNAVSVANERATAQAAVLANQVSASAETLRALVAATAATIAQQLANVTSGFSDRLAALEKAQYENKGAGSGMRDMTGWIFAGLSAIVTVGMLLFTLLH